MSKIMPLISANCGKISPASVEDYVRAGGFSGLQKALKMPPTQIINEVKKAKLRGRGGAGYPAGSKWQQLYEIKHFPKYIVCNADEGEPGTFKDKLLLEKDPLRVIEGMTIAGYVFNAHDGYIYIRGEYAALQDDFQAAIDSAVRAGYLGDKILGTDYSYHLHIMTGAGAYVCGENSAMLNSIEGKVGRPRVKPPHLAEVGLFQQPTLVNNVESFANIPTIMQIGGEKYLSYGTVDSGGTKLICLSGNVANPGVYEVPFGLTLRDLIYDEELGGGPSGQKKIKFFHLGGQSGPCGFLSQLDTPYCYQALRDKGLSVGSGAIVVMDESVCVIDYLKAVTEFFIHESCGKCTPCREGNKQIYALLDKFAQGTASKEDYALLQRLSTLLAKASFCGLGQAAATALSTCLKNLQAEFDAHIEGRCPAGVCFTKQESGEQ
ncbi:MAG: NADH-ubiquinone oxidoreductase-F iron-sulfur binding region domain-containing protein [Clostridia bacterium]|jgi:NADH-quinone oxidoreductase subunit F|nr:NADH-ubiquinone oxidoreductase-F iron-sulfur binding region domain-containing protein [Clostridia bacterium]MDD4145581.1 NADH-ubiquinone oxidoreductase-F iron-sulfur binding region domain-containing protein [Clostridia bacterium]MDD4665970.1 NADH-ubiquinone oxidoreductase-F iron-sulfur binding region domain-containing protein [Clostridia bacterium]